MTDTSASVPPSDDPKPDVADEPEATAEDEDGESGGFGWDAEFDKTDPDLDLPVDLDETPSDDDNSPDTPPTADTGSPKASPQSSPVATGLPPVPEGFKDWNEVALVAKATRAPAQPPPPSSPPLPALRHDDDPVVKDLAKQLLSLPPGERANAVSRLPGDVGSKVVARIHDRDKALEELTSDPYAFVRRVAEIMAAETMEQSPFAARFRVVEDGFKRSLAERFVADNKLEPAELGELHKLVASGMPHNLAVQWIARERQLAALQGKSGKVADAQRQIDANKQAARAQQSAKGRGRSADLEKNRRAELKAAGTDALKIAKINDKYERLGSPLGPTKPKNKLF